MALREISGPGRAQLPEFVDSYYEQLKADYEFAKLEIAPPLAVPATWEDLYRLEMVTLRARAETDLRRSAWVVRVRFRNVAGEASYRAYLASSPPDPATAPAELLLADLVNLLRRTYYLIALAPASEAIRHALLLGAAGIGTLALIAILAIVFLVQPQNLGIFQIVLLAGAVGGTMSLVQRVQALPEADPLLFRLSGRTTIVQSLIIPPLAGAIFAGVLFMIFASGVLSGDIFPAFAVTPPSARGTDFTSFFNSTTPNGGKAYALTIVWSFVAGFAERFVPDTIDRLTAQRAVSAKGAGTNV